MITNEMAGIIVRKIEERTHETGHCFDEVVVTADNGQQYEMPVCHDERIRVGQVCRWKFEIEV